MCLFPFYIKVHIIIIIIYIIQTSRIGILDYISTTMSMLSLVDSSMEEGSAKESILERLLR